MAQIVATTPGLYPLPDWAKDELSHLKGHQKEDLISGNETGDIATTYARARSEVLERQQTAGLDRIVEGQLRWDDMIAHPLTVHDNVETGGIVRYYNNNNFYRDPVVQGELTPDGDVAGELDAASEQVPGEVPRDNLGGHPVGLPDGEVYLAGADGHGPPLEFVRRARVVLEVAGRAREVRAGLRARFPLVARLDVGEVGGGRVRGIDVAGGIDVARVGRVGGLRHGPTSLGRANKCSTITRPVSDSFAPFRVERRARATVRRYNDSSARRASHRV